jgi:hypothetical protein
MGKRFAGSLQLIEAVKDVVAFDDRDSRGQSQPGCQLIEPVGEATRVEAAGVGDDLDAPFQTGAQGIFHLTEEGRCITGGRILLSTLPQDEHG